MENKHRVHSTSEVAIMMLSRLTMVMGIHQRMERSRLWTSMMVWTMADMPNSRSNTLMACKSKTITAPVDLNTVT